VRVRLLLTGGGGAGTVPLWEYWRAQLHDVWVADANPEAIDPLIPPRYRVPIPLASDPAYCTTLLELVREWGIGLVIPTVDEELPIIERLRLFEGVKLLLPDQWFVSVMLDKFGSIRCLRERGIPVPHTTLTKPRYGRGSRDVVVEQDVLHGQEYTVQMMADQFKNLRAVVPVKVARKRGITLDGVTDDNPRVVAACEAIHRAVPTSGTYNIQGVDTGTAFLPFEINPRLSTTTCLAVQAGADPLAIWNGEGMGRARHTVGLTLRRYWRTVIA
jgi:carbamoyl-phosphate synthase large subunit